MTKTKRPIYIPPLQSEVLDIVRTMRRHAKELNLGDDEGRTACVCRRLLYASFDLVEGLYCHIENLNHLAARVIQRSLVEYVVDMLFLSYKNNKTLNERFYRHGKLLRYWFRDKLSSDEKQAVVLRLEREYREWVAVGFQDVREKLSKSSKHPSPEDPEFDDALDEYIKNRFKKHWSGENRSDRLKFIMDCATELSRELHLLNRAFELYSNYTHPTPYSCWSWQGATVEDGKLRFDDWEDPSNIERDILLFLMLLVHGFRNTLPDDMSQEFYVRFYRLIEISAKIRPFMFSFLRK